MQSQKHLTQDRIGSLMNKARAKLKTKDYSEAIKLLTEVLEQIDPGHLDAIFYRAISYLDQGNLQQSISELWRVVEFKKSTDAHQIELCE